MKALNKDRLYVFQLIKKEDGQKSPAVVATPAELLHKLEEEKIDEQEYYIDLLMDVEHVEEISVEERVSMTNMIMAVPMFSVSAFRTLLNMIEDKDNG